jgi:radical SAM protein with 4Fe4S-binding SPASM domain
VPDVVSSLPLDGKAPIYYYPNANVLTFDGGNDALLHGSEEFGRTLFRLYLGLRKIKALKRSKKIPKVLFVEPWRTCNIACTYCYAQAGPESKKTLDFGNLASLIEKYHFDRALIFGGEPLIHKDYIRALYALREWDSFFFSTNGILMDEQFLYEIVNSPNVNVQVSLEPEEWSYRINRQGRKQFDLLRSRMKLLAGRKFTFRVVIPPDAPYIPITEFIDRLAHELDSYDFAIVYWPTYGDKIPEWVDSWLDESYHTLGGAESWKYRNKLLGDSFMDYLLEMQTEGFRFYNCNAAYGSVSIGPDGKLHGCHEDAVVESDSDIVSTDADPLEIDENKMLKLTYRWTNNMSNDDCANCQARYTCGGLCFLARPPDSACYLLRKMLPLILTEMTAFKPKETLGLISRTESTFGKLYAMREGLRDEVMNEKWTRLVSGELPLEEAVELATIYSED